LLFIHIRISQQRCIFKGYWFDDQQLENEKTRYKLPHPELSLGTPNKKSKGGRLMGREGRESESEHAFSN
jgi:hypothetical protein